MSEASSERAALLEQLAGYLVWEAELGGGFLPAQSSAPAPRAVAAGSERRPDAPPELAAASSGQPQARARDVSPPVDEAPAPPARLEAPAPVAAAPAPISAPVPRAAPATDGEPDLRRRLALIDDQVRACTRCELHSGRTHTVFARGNPDAQLVFVGEGPGQEEDRTGQPFVGPAGQLLDRMVAAMGLGRDDVYICN
ncbi:MAG TPA: uracil-DNA glycosylase family protein, partial [Polyangiales bacterium]